MVGKGGNILLFILAAGSAVCRVISPCVLIDHYSSTDLCVFTDVVGLLFYIRRAE